MTTPIQQTLSFLSGRILLDVTMISSWLETINLILPQTTDVLNEQLTDVQTEINALLATIPQTNVVSGKAITSISLVADFKYALASVEYQFHGNVPRYNDYMDTTDEVDSVYNQYSITFMTNGPSILVIF